MKRTAYIIILLFMWILSITAFAADEEYSLTVSATPANSRVRIMNITPKYHPGIKLSPGRYNILVDKPGYAPYKRWVL